MDAEFNGAYIPGKTTAAYKHRVHLLELALKTVYGSSV